MTQTVKFILALVLLFLAVVPARAATTEASVSAEKIQQSIQDRIRRAIAENLNSPEASGQPRLKAFIGKVETLTEATLTVLVPNQNHTTSKQVVTDAETIVVKSGKGKIDFGSISLTDQVIAMGVTSDNQTMTALRIVVDTPPKTPTITTEVVTGTISSLNPKTRTLTLDTANPKLIGQDIVISRRAQIVDSDLETLTLADLEESQNIIAIVEIDSEDETNVSYRVMVFPTGLSPTPSQTSNTCGDNICQNVVCSGVGCPTPETPQTCPTDCKPAAE